MSDAFDPGNIVTQEERIRSRGVDLSDVEPFEETLRRKHQEALTKKPDKNDPGAIVQRYDKKTAEEQKAFEERPGALETAATSFGRGVLDVLLTPGALAGALTETAGFFAGNEWMQEFGRDLGQAATSRAAIEAGAALYGASGGGGDEGALSASEAAGDELTAQEKEWPLLAAITRLGGSVAAGAGLGALGGVGRAASSARTVGTLGALEGAGGGAQVAYEQDKPLEEVLTSALLWGTVGGALGYGGTRLSERAGERIAKARGRLATVAEAGGKEAQEVINTLRRSRDELLDVVKKSSDNEQLRAMANVKQRAKIMDRIEKRAGKVDPNWDKIEPSPMQKWFHRTEILDRVSVDLADDVRRVIKEIPSPDFTIKPKLAARLAEGARPTEAISAAQSKVLGALEELPLSVESTKAREALLGAAKRLQVAEFGDAMSAGHDAVVSMRKMAAEATDDLLQKHLNRQASDLEATLGSDAFGRAGEAYRAATAKAAALAEAIEPGALRPHLRKLSKRGQLEKSLADQGRTLMSAKESIKKLSGTDVAKRLDKELARLSEKAQAAEKALTLDGGPVKRIFESLREDASERAASAAFGGLVGGVPGFVLGAVSPGITFRVVREATRGLAASVKAYRKVKPHLAAARRNFGATGGGIVFRRPESWSLKPDLKMAYDERMETLERYATAPDPEQIENGVKGLPAMPEQMHANVQADFKGKVQKLIADMPKPTPHIGGKAYEQLSEQDLRLANAMWEATMRPLSVFEDFERGIVDYDKVQYAWQMYPGLQMASQMAILDILHSQLSDDERVRIPQAMLTQLDYLLGFNGTIQESVHIAFSGQMDAMGEKFRTEEPSRPKPSTRAESLIAKHKQSYTERLAQ